ncbi:Ada3 domain containing protein [Pyrenophora tritici-repentis]|nr:Ada3 domain-containing protein [Pyrenophora tritici-repentis]KAG9383045.1 Ada3 domain containing protein [Pyrenophora tritici-repentis]KAI0578606.1 Ada3 domain-containing protein [Pyrenophora tritici-repentis]KAI0583295.1 Ada3 domain-containing protein [Pyrenophora tritici-repentis]KAI0610267.1 Ada3 domain-containing protein [Pyrenophora tritici-repentis]
MAPTGLSSKGKATKPGSKPSQTPRSRNTTPLPHKSETTVEEVLESGGNGSQIPSGKQLLVMRDHVEKTVMKNAEARCTQSEGALRELMSLKKNRAPRERDRDKAGEDRDRKHKLKKVNTKQDDDSKHPPVIGAHGVARQDGGDAKEPTATTLTTASTTLVTMPRRRRSLIVKLKVRGFDTFLTQPADNSSAISSPISQAPPSATGTGPADAPSPSGSDVSHQPAPAPAVPQFQTFGPDPAKFDDPTIYHIREVTPGMSIEERKEIYCVAEFPQEDLRDKIAGSPPDKDFSNAKPPSQVNATVFANYVEPYIRPLTEEDVAFLKERGDRVGPFVLPRRGQRHYKEIWAEEDGAMHIDSNDQHPPPNVPRGAAEDITDDNLETDQVSAGPLLSRLLSTLRPEGRGNQNSHNEQNGVNGDAMDIDEGAGTQADATNTNSLPAAAQLPDLVQPGWKASSQNARTDYAGMEDRVLMELKHYGLISDADAESQSFDAHFDDEVAARLRFLQEELRKQSIINGARKQRLLELTEERIAQQEYNTIADDLDNQLNAAYLKRNRNIGKGKKQNKRPGGAGGGSHPVANAGISRPGVGEPIRTLMERRQQWINTIGPVVNFGKTGLPTETIFGEEKMKELENREVEIWNTEAEE